MMESHHVPADPPGGLGFRPSPVLALFVALLCAALPSPSVAQDGDSDVRELRAEVQRLGARLADAAAREQALSLRLDALESESRSKERRHEERIAELEAADRESALGVRVDEAVARLSGIERALGDEAPIAIGGYFDIEFRDDEARSSSTFDQHRLILKIDAAIAEALSFRSEIEIEGGGIASNLTDSAVKVEYAEIHAHFAPWLNLKAGALLMPFLRVNTLHDSPLQDLTDRPLVDVLLVPTTWTDAGVGVYGGWDIGPFHAGFDVVLTNGLDDDFS